MMTPPAANASIAPSVPALWSQPEVSTIQPKPIIAPNPTNRASQLLRTFTRPVPLTSARGEWLSVGLLMAGSSGRDVIVSAGHAPV